MDQNMTRVNYNTISRLEEDFKGEIKYEENFCNWAVDSDGSSG